MKNLMRNIPQELKETRKQLDFTQKQLAEKIGINRASVANYESGRLRTPLDVYLKIQGLVNQKGTGSTK